MNIYLYVMNSPKVIYVVEVYQLSFTVFPNCCPRRVRDIDFHQQHMRLGLGSWLGFSRSELWSESPSVSDLFRRWFQVRGVWKWETGQGKEGCQANACPRAKCCSAEASAWWSWSFRMLKNKLSLKTVPKRRQGSWTFTFWCLIVMLHGPAGDNPKHAWGAALWVCGIVAPVAEVQCVLAEMFCQELAV